jgi:hypothetical protein
MIGGVLMIMIIALAADLELSQGQMIEGVGDFISQMMYLVMQCKRKVVLMLVLVGRIGAAHVV